MKKLLLSTFIILLTLTSYSQSKVGTVDSEYIISQMPELKQAQDALKAYNVELEGQLKEKVTNYETVLKAAEAKFESMTDTEKKAKQEEVVGLEKDITAFRNNATQLVQIKQGDLLRPLYAKIGEQVTVYAKANSFTQILNTSNNNSMAYLDPAFDITIEVAKGMGITLKQE